MTTTTSTVLAAITTTELILSIVLLVGCGNSSSVAEPPPEGWDGYYELRDDFPASCSGGFEDFRIAGRVAPVSGSAIGTCGTCPAASNCPPASVVSCTKSQIVWAGTVASCRAKGESVREREGLCIRNPSEVECPAGTAFTERHVLFNGVTDTRYCSACQCLYHPGTFGCDNVGGGDSAGGLAPADPITYCCMP